MKLSKMTLAIALMAGATSTFAAPAAGAIVRISGASAIKGNFAVALNGLCTTAGGVMQEWISASNISTYVCTPAGGLTSGTSGTYASTASTAFIPFEAVSGFVEVRLNVAGGSFTALQSLAGAVNGSFSDRYVDPDAGGVSVVGGAANSGTTGGAIVTEVGIGGFSDVNYQGFAPTVLATVPGIDTIITNNTAQEVGVAQGFGVAVSNPLYQAMFTAQQATVSFPNRLIPASCSVTDTSNPLCVPSIGKGQMAAIMSANTFSAAKTLGAPFLAPQLAANSELRYARRVDTSGTQASAVNYFLGIGNMITPVNVFTDPSDRTNPLAVTAASGCNIGDLRGPGFGNQEVDSGFIANGQIDLCDRKSGNLRTLGAPGTGDVRNELNKTTILGGASNYAIGVMSLENSQPTFRNVTDTASLTTQWKFIRVQKANGADNATPVSTNANRATMIDGEYDFFYETWSYTLNDAAGKNDAIVGAIIGQVTAGPALRGLVVIGTSTNQSPYNRGGRTDTPSSR